MPGPIEVGNRVLRTSCKKGASQLPASDGKRGAEAVVRLHGTGSEGCRGEFTRRKAVGEQSVTEGRLLQRKLVLHAGGKYHPRNQEVGVLADAGVEEFGGEGPGVARVQHDRDAQAARGRNFARDGYEGVNQILRVSTSFSRTSAPSPSRPCPAKQSMKPPPSHSGSSRKFPSQGSTSCKVFRKRSRVGLRSRKWASSTPES